MPQPKKMKHCAKCAAPIARPVLAPHDASELCPGCAMSYDPGSEIGSREAQGAIDRSREGAGFGFCSRCGGEHCPHYACTHSGGQGCCDGCAGGDDE